MPALQADKRARIVRAIMAESRKQGIDDELRRDIIRQACGKASLTELTIPELGRVLDAIKGRTGARRQPARGRALADSDHARKIRALWLSLWHLGAVDSPAEAAIAAFAERQLGVQALQWVTPHQASSIIEALRGIGRRHGWDVAPGVSRELAELSLIVAQQDRARALGLELDMAALGMTDLATPASRGRLIARIGDLIRGHKGGARG